MLKLAGSLIIVIASALYGWKIRKELQEHVEQLVGMKEMFLMLQGEISYTRTPLKEAFLQIAAQDKDAVGIFWRRLIEQESDKFLFNSEEQSLLQRAGENFGYLDGQMQLKNLELYIEQTEVLIKKAQAELKQKQKLSGALSLMCGLFLIILLI